MAKRNKQQQRELKKQKQQNQPKSEQPNEQPSEQPSPKTKKWKRVGIFSSFEEATQVKTKLTAEAGDLEIKIRRCGDGGDMFQVKVR